MRSFSMKLMMVVLLAPLGLIALSAPTGAATARRADELRKQPKYLTLSQMPTGWTVDNGPTSSSGCLAEIPAVKNLKVAAHITVNYDDDTGFPYLKEELASYSGSAKKALVRIRDTFKACHHAGGIVNDQTASGTMGQMSFSQYGSDSAAFSAALQIGQNQVGYEVFVSRFGNEILAMSMANVGPPSTGLFRKFVKEAARDVEGKATTLTPATSTTTVPPTTTTAPPTTTTTTTAPPPPPTTVPPPTTTPPTAAPAGCTPISDEGTCYEPGEYCRDDDHGVTGVAGDGATITCEDNNGWRWEPT
jgi:hypothetical protein